MMTSSPAPRPRSVGVAVMATLLAGSLAAAPAIGPASTVSDDAAGAAAPAAPAAVEIGADGFPDHIDPQSWELPSWQTAEDYTPIPGVDWNAPENQAAKPIRAALLVADFPDQPFLATQEPGSSIFGVDEDWMSRVPGYEGLAEDGRRANPMLDEPVAREDVAEHYADLLTEPSELNGGHTVNEYWLEDSYGLIGVDVTAFGPYRMKGKQHEYGLAGGDAGDAPNQCPQEDDCDRRELGLPFVTPFMRELIEAATVDTTTGMVFNAEDYDFRWLLRAGQGESDVWQEFGEMMFAGPDEVTPEFGPPGPVLSPPAVCVDRGLECPNAAETRYVDWTSWGAGAALWSSAVPGVTSTQAESSSISTFSHELSHIFGVLDNYNNPFAGNLSRSYTGPWAMLSRGTFNAPRGPHARWEVGTPSSANGSHHMLRNKIRLGFTPPHEVLTVTPELLQATGPIATDVYPRAYPLFPVTETTGHHGIMVAFGQDQSDCSHLEPEEQYRCDGGMYDSYTVEVVDRIGHDSFTPDHGVLIAKALNGTDVPAPFMWAIDAHPEDINTVTGVGEHEGREVYDFIRPGTGDPDDPDSGERVPISLGDYRQLADALFHAGTAPGVVDEWVDEANGLHFYVLTTARDHDDPETIGSYRVAVRSLDGHGPIDPATTVAGDGTASGAPGEVVPVTFTLENSSQVTDIVRLTHDAGAATSRRLYDVVEVPAGGTATVSVWVRIGDDGGDQPVSLTATSELTGEAVTAT